MTTITDYNKQAADLLALMGVKMHTAFITHDYFFTDDKQTRDIYRVTFIREKKAWATKFGKHVRFSIRFGQSLKDSVYANGSTPPTAYDVLSGIQKYEVGSFEDFCTEYGYDQDSRKSEKTYKAVVKEYEKVSNFFVVAEVAQLQEIQ